MSKTKASLALCLVCIVAVALIGRHMKQVTAQLSGGQPIDIIALELNPEDYWKQVIKGIEVTQAITETAAVEKAVAAVARNLQLDNTLFIPAYTALFILLGFSVLWSQHTNRLFGVASIAFAVLAAVCDFRENHYLGLFIHGRGEVATAVRGWSLLKWSFVLLAPLTAALGFFLRGGIQATVERILSFGKRCLQHPWPFWLGLAVAVALMIYNRWPMQQDWDKWQAVLIFVVFFVTTWLLYRFSDLPTSFVPWQHEGVQIPATPLTVLVFYVSMGYILLVGDTLQVNPWHVYLLAFLFLFSFGMTRRILDGPSQLLHGSSPREWLRLFRRTIAEEHWEQSILLILVLLRWLLLVPLTVLWLRWSVRDFWQADVIALMQFLAQMSLPLVLWLLFIIAYRLLLVGLSRERGVEQKMDLPHILVQLQRIAEQSIGRVVRFAQKRAIIERAFWQFSLLSRVVKIAAFYLLAVWIPLVCLSIFDPDKADLQSLVTSLGSYWALVSHLIYPVGASGVLIYGMQVLRSSREALQTAENQADPQAKPALPPGFRPAAVFFCFFLVPFFATWISMSLLDTYQRWLQPQPALAIASRSSPQGTTPSAEENSPPQKVWLALSGGGYRAAAIHLGVLRGLEQKGITPDLISAVSGGSIIGAFYAAGGTLQQFEKVLQYGNDFLYQLRRKKDVPKLGLWDFIFHIYNVAKTLIPGISRTDIYAAFYRMAYFGERRLSAVQRSHLLINTTDLDQEKRVVFYGLRGADVEPLDSLGVLYGGTAGSEEDLDLGRAVAASGAFPVAFRPLVLREKAFRWENAQVGRGISKPLTKRQFIDGGVIENLGLDGFRVACQDANVKRRIGHPSVLIVSDASMETKDLSEGEPSFGEIVSAAPNVVSQSDHERLLAAVVGGLTPPRYAFDTPFAGSVPLLCAPPTEAGQEAAASQKIELIFVDPTSEKGREELCRTIAQSPAVDLCQDLQEQVGRIVKKEDCTDPHSAFNLLLDKVSAIPTLKDLNFQEVKMAVAVGECALGVFAPQLKSAEASGPTDPERGSASLSVW